MHRNSAAVLLALSLAFAGQSASAATCVPLSGLVKLEPDPTCQIANKYQGPTYIGVLDPSSAATTCFSVSVRGPTGLLLIGSGFSGLTVEAHVSAVNGSASATPSILIQELDLAPQMRRFFTARSVINLLGSNLFSADAGVIAQIGATQQSTEQLLITRGEGAWQGASGAIYPRGNIIQHWAPFSGQICKP